MHARLRGPTDAGPQRVEKTHAGALALAQCHLRTGHFVRHPVQHRRVPPLLGDSRVRETARYYSGQRFRVAIGQWADSPLSHVADGG